MVPQTEGRTSVEAEAGRELAAESRERVIGLLKETSALDIERAVTRLTGNPAAAQMVRQLVFWDDKKKMCEDFWVFKGPADWQEELGLPRGQVRSGNKDIEEHGLAEIDTERRNPTNNNKTTFYQLNPWKVAQAVAPARLEELEPELRYLDPDLKHDAVEADDRCPTCGDDFCDGSCAEAAHWEPVPVKEDDPFHPFLADFEDEPTPRSGEPTPGRVEPTPGFVEPTIQKNPHRAPQENTTGESTLSEWRGPLSRPVATADIEEVEEQKATSPPSVAALTPSTRTTQARTRTVRDLLEPGGKLAHLVDDALAWGEQAAPILARYVSWELGGKPEQHVEAVRLALMAMWKSESGVAA